MGGEKPEIATSRTCAYTYTERAERSALICNSFHMSLLQYVYLYALTVPVFFAIDMLWLGVVARGFYRVQLASFLGPVVWPAAFSFYFLYIVGILVFAVAPALAAGSLTRAIVLGAFFGLVAYATYDLTNLATVKNWPLTLTLVDMAWGAVLTGSVAVLSFLIGRALFLS